MYVAKGGRTYTGFTMLNPKYSSVSTPNVGPCLGCAAGNCGGCSENKSLGFYRPNQAMNRSVYPGYSSPQGGTASRANLRHLSLIQTGRTKPGAAFHPALAGVQTGRKRRLSGLGQAATDIAAGTTLQYNCQLTVPWSAFFPSGVASDIGANLASQWGINILNEQDSGAISAFLSSSSTLTLTVQTTRDYGSAADIKSIIDGAIENDGASLISSSISVVATPGVAQAVQSNVPALQSQYNAAVASGDSTTATALQSLLTQFGIPAATAATPSSVTGWLGSNWPWLVGGGVAAYLAAQIIRDF